MRGLIASALVLGMALTSVCAKAQSTVNDSYQNEYSLAEAIQTPPEETVELSEVAKVIELDNVLPENYNYFQGFEAKLFPGKAVVILGDIGDCCPWPRPYNSPPESSVALVYPYDGEPYWRVFFYPNEWEQRPILDEMEAYTLDATYDYDLDVWRLAYTSTSWSTLHKENRARMGLHTTTSLFDVNAPVFRIKEWITPITPGCEEPGSCSGTGTGWQPQFLQLDGTTYLFHGEEIVDEHGNRIIKGLNAIWNITNWRNPELLIPYKDEQGNDVQVRYVGKGWNTPRDIGFIGTQYEAWGINHGPVFENDKFLLWHSNDAVTWNQSGSFMWKGHNIWDPTRLEYLNGEYSSDVMLVAAYGYGEDARSGIKTVLFVDPEADLPRCLLENHKPRDPPPFESITTLEGKIALTSASFQKEEKELALELYVNGEEIGTYNAQRPYSLDVTVDIFAPYQHIILYAKGDNPSSHVDIGRIKINNRPLDWSMAQHDADVNIVDGNAHIDWGGSLSFLVPTEYFLPATPIAMRGSRRVRPQ